MSKLADFEKKAQEANINLLKEEKLAPYTTLKIGGPAKYFAEVEKDEDLILLIKLAQEFNLDYYIFGWGSNLLVSDKGFDGLVIKNNIKGIKVEGNKILIKSGNFLSELVKTCLENGFLGMEKMAGIPGTVGGAIYGNAGAYGEATSDHLEAVKVFDGGKIVWLKKNDMEFGYRDSGFKRKKYLILEGEFVFSKGNKEEIKNAAKETVTLRGQKYSSQMQCPGSFFKNIIADNLPKEVLAKIPPEKINHGKIPAGVILEMVGAKGDKKGQIKIMDYHANLFVNLGGGKASDLLFLAGKYQKKVKDELGIDLLPEVQMLGF